MFHEFFIIFGTARLRLHKNARKGASPCIVAENLSIYLPLKMILMKSI